MADADVNITAELILRRGSSMVIHVEVPTADLVRFFIGAQITVMGAVAQIEKMEALQSVVHGLPGNTPLALTLLLL